MLMQATRARLRGNQQGFAAIVIAIVLVLVLSLLTIGFAELMRQETRSALDKHLSQQAYYAAETGVNDAAKAINDGFADTKPNCSPLAAGNTAPGAQYLKKKDVANADEGVSYTCLLIDPAPKTLEYGSTSDMASRIIQISGANPADSSQPELIDHLIISWEDDQRKTNFAPAAGSAYSFPNLANWSSDTGMLRISLTPLMSGGISRKSFADNTYQAFLYPNGASAGTQAYSYADGTGDSGGVILNGNCNTSKAPRYCNVRINFGTASQANFLMALRWVYSSPHVTIAAYDSAGTQLRIKNAQVLVDSTGKAQDVLRRVQARIPVRNNYNHTDYGLEIINGICKQIQTVPDQAPTRECTP